MPRFVILHHTTPPGYPRPSHYDFMLEVDGVMKTWSLPAEPLVGVSQMAEQIHDHRLDYFDYEGPVSENRGDVRRWDRGKYVLVSQSENEWVVQLIGGSLKGVAKLQRSGHDPREWEVRITS